MNNTNLISENAGDWHVVGLIVQGNPKNYQQFKPHF
ncbi:NapD [Haemophilus influenzae 22.1-21]|nr:NapD [Haemophilus influenzae 22.1-21]